MNRDELERRFDGPIPQHLLRAQSEHEFQSGHHRAMIRFSEARIQDFTDSLQRLLASPSTSDRETWIARTRAIITDHEAEIARHRQALIDLLARAP